MANKTRKSFQMQSDRRQIGRRRVRTNSVKEDLRNGDRRLWSEKNSDRRAFRRVAGPMPVLLSFEDELFNELSESTVEFSSHGFRLRTTREYPVNAQCWVCLYPPELYVPIQVAATVRWRKYEPRSKTFVYGFSLDQISNENQNLIEQFIEKEIKEKGSVSSLRSRLNDFFYKKILRRLLIHSRIGDQGIIKGKADSGITFDHIYSNKANGDGFIGHWIDRLLLNLPAAKASRFRKDLIQSALRQEIQSNIGKGQITKILDLGAGTGKYLTETIRRKDRPHVQALAIDQDMESIEQGRAASNGHPIRFLRLDVFKANRLRRLSLRSGWRPNVIIVSGLIYYFNDRKARYLIEQIQEWLQPGGLLILTNMIRNPNKRLIGKLFLTQKGAQWIPLGRPIHIVRSWLSDAGFVGIKHTTDPWGMYCVFNVRKAREAIRTIPFEIKNGNGIIRGKIHVPNERRNLKGYALFVHGLGYTHSAYRLNPELFCNEGLGLCVFNMNGHGNSDGDWRLDSSIEAVKRIIDLISKSNSQTLPIFLFGHSTGALIAMLAGIGNYRISGAIAVSIVNSVTDSYKHWHRSGYNQKVKEFFKTNEGVPPIIEAFLDDQKVMASYRDGEKPWTDLKFPYRYGLMHGTSFGDLAEPICFSPNVVDQISKVHFPVALFIGKEDESVPIATLETLFSKLQCQKRLIRTDATKHFHEDRWDFIQAESIAFLKDVLTQ